jgi:hypothetical protein
VEIDTDTDLDTDFDPDAERIAIDILLADGGFP